MGSYSGEDSFVPNKYLSKVAEFNYNINDNIHHGDPYEISRKYEVDTANDILVNRGFKPKLDISSAHLATAHKIGDMDAEADRRPLERSANNWSTLGGLVSGGLTAVALGNAGIKPPLPPLAGLVVGVGVGAGLKKLLYSADKRSRDDAHVEKHTNALLEYLSSRYEKD